MRVLSIEEIVKMDDGEVVPSVRGKVKSIYDRQQGTNDKGEWSVQSIVLAGRGGDIKAKFWNHPPLSKDLKGREVMLSCKDGDKGKTGLYVAEDTYQGKVTKQLRVTGTGTIETVLDDSAPQEATPTPPAAQSPATPKPAAAPAQPKKLAQESAEPSNGQSDAARATKNRLAELASLYLVCLDASCYVEGEFNQKHAKVPGHGPMSDAHFQACTSSLFIQATREMLSMPKAGKNGGSHAN